MAITIHEAKRAYKDQLPRSEANQWRRYIDQMEDAAEHETRILEFEAEFFDVMSEFCPDDEFPIRAAAIVEQYDFRAALRKIERDILDFSVDKSHDFKLRLKNSIQYLIEFDPNVDSQERRLLAQKVFNEMIQQDKELRSEESAARKGYR